MAAENNRMTASTAEQGLLEIANLINHREYNLSLVRCRQFLESVLKSYTEINDIPYETMAETIDKLYSEGIVNSVSRNAFHDIRMLGNQAVHDAGASDSETAQKAYYLLKQELETYINSITRPAALRDRTPVDISVLKPVERAAASDVGGRGRNTRAERAEQKEEASGRSSGRKKVPSREDRLRAVRGTAKKGQVTFAGILKVAVPVLCLLLLLIILKSLFSGKKKQEPVPVETTVAVTEPMTQTQPPETEPPTEPPTTEPEPVRYKVSGTNVNVRFADNQSRIYTQLQKGYEIGTVQEIEGSDFVRFSLDGKQMVISKNFIEPVE